MSARQTRKYTLGIVGVNYLRERGIAQMREDVKVCYIGPADSSLHRIADYSVPVPTLDISAGQLKAVIRRAGLRGVRLDGIVSLRDPNVLMVAYIARKLRLLGPPPNAIHNVARKFRFRRFLNRCVPKNLHTKVSARFLKKGISRAKFDKIIRALLRKGPVIVKPDRGSCSYHVTEIQAGGDPGKAWRRFKKARNYRHGDFIVETKLVGRELAVETIVGRTVLDMRITQYLDPEKGLFHETGHFVRDEFSAKERRCIFDLVAEMHRKLDLKHIITHTELILPENGLPGVVELNPRLAGDLTQELHRITAGIDYYRIQARLATGQPLPRKLFGSPGKYPCALIRFSSPSTGRFKIGEWPVRELRSPEDQIGVIRLDRDALGDTNDDRPAYVLLAGKNRVELDKRAAKCLERIKRAV